MRRLAAVRQKSQRAAEMHDFHELTKIKIPW